MTACFSQVTWAVSNWARTRCSLPASLHSVPGVTSRAPADGDPLACSDVSCVPGTRAYHEALTQRCVC